MTHFTSVVPHPSTLDLNTFFSFFFLYNYSFIAKLFNRILMDKQVVFGIYTFLSKSILFPYIFNIVNLVTGRGGWGAWLCSPLTLGTNSVVNFYTPIQISLAEV